MIRIRCKMCNTELEGHPGKTKTCGCPNMTSVTDDIIGALDLSEVIIVDQYKNNVKKPTFLSDADLKYQEDRRRRKVRKLDFEER